MLYKSKDWICIMIKHLLILTILLNHMFELGSADSNEEQLDNNIALINDKVLALKEMVNHLKQQLAHNNVGTSDINELNAIMNRIKRIENKLNALVGKGGDSENIKVVVHNLESEMENLRKSLDNIIKGIIQDKNTFKNSLSNITDAYKDLAKRLAILEEPKRLKDLEEQLTKRAYRDAKISVDAIVHDDKLIEVMSKVYEQQRDIDGYLYLTNMAESLTRRLSIYKYIYNEVILKTKYPPLKGQNATLLPSRNETLSNCYKVHLINRLENIIAQVTNVIAPESADINSKASNLTAVCKSSLKQVYDNFFKGKTQTYKGAGFGNFINNTNFNDTTAVVGTAYNGSDDSQQMLFQIKWYLGKNLNEQIIDYWSNLKLLLFRRLTIRDLLRETSKDYNDIEAKSPLAKNRTSISVSNYGRMFLISLKESNYKIAAEVYKQFKSTNETIDVMKQYCNEFVDIDPLLNTAVLLTENDRELIYTTLNDAINTTYSINICEMLKLHDSLVTLKNTTKFVKMINTLKQAITAAIKSNTNQYVSAKILTDLTKDWTLVESDFNEITYHSKADNKILGKRRYYLTKGNLKNNCYFDGKISVNNFNDFYWKNKFDATSKWMDLWAIFMGTF